MALGVFLLLLPGGDVGLARGDASRGPEEMLPRGRSIDALVSTGELERVLLDPSGGSVPDGARVLAPLGSQEVWAAGVTYLRSRDARVEESLEATPYDRVYTAPRPELFFKAPAWRVRGPGEPIGVRRDSSWNVPEPEVALLLDDRARVVGYTIGNDVSSRSIEGENPLYLPQAKVYDGSCALGPCVVPASEAHPPFHIRMEVIRQGALAFEGETSTERMRRSFRDLSAHLARALQFPVGAFLLTGTGVVPEPDFTLTPGDLVRIAVEDLGVLENPVEAVGEAG